MVCTEFIEMAEEKFGFDAVESMLAGSNLTDGGAYTAVGTYDHGEMIQMVVRLSAIYHGNVVK